MTSVLNLSFDRRLSRSEAYELIDVADIDELLTAAAKRRDAAHGDVITYSPKVFIPLTQLCRDVCHYCTFAHAPRSNVKPYLSVEEAVSIAKPARKLAVTRRYLRSATSPSFVIASRVRS